VDLTGWLARLACRRPHLLLAEVPGSRGVRVAVEQHARTQGWVVAQSPADADLLVVCGRPGDELAFAVEVAWEAMAVPRARVELTGQAAVAAALASAVDRLADVDAQRQEAAARADSPPPVLAAHDSAAQGAGDSHQDGEAPGDMDHAEMGHDTGDMDMDMDMDMPGGLVMADRAPDRDGLQLDVLHLRLGPFLPCWPAGLVLDVVLQGDVVQSSTVAVLGAEQGPATPGTDTPAQRAADHLDSAARLLELSGWQAAADRARLVRDEVPGVAQPADLLSRLEQLADRVGRSRSLHWSLRDLGLVTDSHAALLGIGGPAQRAGGDVRDRLLQWLQEAQDQLTGERVAEPSPAGAIIQALPGLVQGLELAGVRLVVASLDPDLAGLVLTTADGHAGHRG